MIQTVAQSRLCGYVCTIAEVNDLDRGQMFALMNRYYENVSRSAFESDFDSKTWVIVAKCPITGSVLGFSTQWFGDYVIHGEHVGVLYSGDTIVDPAYWARNPLATLWGRLALQLIDGERERELFWFLISKGYKTYRFLPVFFNSFYPRPEVDTPPRYRQIIDHVAAIKFGSRYDPSRGIIKAHGDGCRLRHHVAEVTQQRLRDPFVKFFDDINPRHPGGDELCCLAGLSRENLNRAAYRVISSPLDPPRESGPGDADHSVP